MCVLIYIVLQRKPKKDESNLCGWGRKKSIFFWQERDRSTDASQTISTTQRCMFLYYLLELLHYLLVLLHCGLGGHAMLNLRNTYIPSNHIATVNKYNIYIFRHDNDVSYDQETACWTDSRHKWYEVAKEWNEEEKQCGQHLLQVRLRL